MNAPQAPRPRLTFPEHLGPFERASYIALQAGIHNAYDPRASRAVAASEEAPAPVRHALVRRRADHGLTPAGALELFTAHGSISAAARVAGLSRTSFRDILRDANGDATPGPMRVGAIAGLLFLPLPAWRPSLTLTEFRRAS